MRPRDMEGSRHVHQRSRSLAIRCSTGFSLIEFLVALAVFSLVSLGLVQTLMTAHAARRTSAQWMRATQLAEQCIERVRAGDSVSARMVDGFSVYSVTAAISGYTGLRDVGVTVAWTDPRPQVYLLRVLVRERP